MNNLGKRNEKAISLFRAMAGAYLLYIDYKLLSGWGEIKSDQKPLFAIIMVIFGAAGIALLVFSIKYLYFNKNKQEDSEEKADGENIVDAKAEELPDQEKTDNIPESNQTDVTAETGKETADKETVDKETSDEK